MANLRDIKRRITSVESTQKITSAMKMVAAAKLRRAQEAIENARPYAVRMRATLEEVSKGTLEETHPLLEVHDERKNLEIVVVTSDRGLAGAFNSAVLKEVETLLAERESQYEKVGFTLLGKKAGDYFRRRRGDQITLDSPIGGDVTYDQAADVARDLARRYVEGELDEVMLVYSEFVSTMTQKPVVAQLLPFVPPEADDAADEGGEEALPYEIEPDPESLLAALVPKAVEVEVFRALLENQAGEHAARMTAMENATRNTEDLIDSLTLEYNRARQAAITKELVEIVTGAQALE
ncbi:MAG: ATP synthase F1 subunit gamma [Deltaproteobacteria bacterium]|nr:ATP synthase F1 subunit gamma [Deltaproteobacteria bacterium]MBW2500559.1 ATP synthase F1 subunit gamma [Deltaproteobacteria bacterium]